MAFHDKHGVTVIRDDDQDHLTVHYEIQGELDDQPGTKIAQLLFTPDLGYPEIHYHIDLSIEQAEKLKNWLEQYLEQRDIEASLQG